MDISKEKNSGFEYRIIAKDGTERILLSKESLFSNDSDEVIELRDFNSEPSNQEPLDLDSISTFNSDTIASALYQIANNAFVADDNEQFFENIHNIIAKLTYAEN